MRLLYIHVDLYKIIAFMMFIFFQAEQPMITYARHGGVIMDTAQSVSGPKNEVGEFVR
jgi:hypothetical protein